MFLEDTIQVQAGGRARGYPIRVGPGIRRSLHQMIPAHAKAHWYAVIADERVAELYARDIAEGLKGGDERFGFSLSLQGKRRKRGKNGPGSPMPCSAPDSAGIAPW